MYKHIALILGALILGNTTAGLATEGKRISLSDQAYVLLITGREEINPRKIGLASVIYFALGEEEEARTYLVEATNIAKEDTDVETLRWLADIWEAKRVGAGDSERAKNCREVADDSELIGVRGGTRGTRGTGGIPKIQYQHRESTLE